ncbi:MAG: biotin--[acetyl-CoA-carboxylase] ligase [Gammaproteobacteria bacterium]|nr:biotin--[acetyl-CoA-carboxylase] ligase [Gammaproteobacteria bacterium]
MTFIESSPFAPLSRSAIRNAMSDSSYQQLGNLSIYESVASTNDQLWQRLEQGLDTPAVCLSEHQTAGRGRRGDQWQSPPAGNLYLSLFWPFPANTLQNGLSIAIGIGLINTLKAHGISDLQLKWPNDVLVNRHKLAGILVESRFGNQHNTVIGVGLNFKLPTATRDKIQQPTTSLQQLCTEVPCRNELAGHLIQNMIETLTLFQARGLQDFVPLWSQYDALHNATIQLISDDVTQTVKAQGIDENGALRYEHQNQLHTLSNSHVSIRFAS